MENTPNYLPGIAKFSILDIINGAPLAGNKHYASNNNRKLLNSTEKFRWTLDNDCTLIPRVGLR